MCNSLTDTHRIGDLVRLACVAEVLAPKAGNVHPASEFQDTTWLDFIASAIVTAPLLEHTGEQGVGQTVLTSVRITKETVGSNTNLGILLLLAPLCAVPRGVALSSGIQNVLSTLNQADGKAVYEAIRLANPGGLGSVPDGDVRQHQSLPLIDAMQLAAPHDAVARQYANSFVDVIERIAPRLSQADLPVDQALVRAHLEQMAHEPDSLIARKCGASTAKESQTRAVAVLAADWPHSGESLELFDDLDDWLRADGHRRNPGTSADLVTAGLFSALREGWIERTFEWSLPLSSIS